MSPFSARPFPGEAHPYLQFSELSDGQRLLLGTDGRQVYEGMNREQRGVFLILSSRLLAQGLDLQGLTVEVDSVRPNRLLIGASPEALHRLRGEVDERVRQGQFGDERPFAPFHWGRSEWGVRESRRKYSMQLGAGDQGAFIDIDRFNPQFGWLAFLLHLFEVLIPGKPSAEDMAKSFDLDIYSKKAPHFGLVSLPPETSLPAPLGRGASAGVPRARAS